MFTTLRPLNYMPYNKEMQKREIIGFKTIKVNMENHFLQNFFQEYYLPKFKIDKRRAHLSSLILSNQITREKL